MDGSEARGNSRPKIAVAIKNGCPNSAEPIVSQFYRTAMLIGRSPVLGRLAPAAQHAFDWASSSIDSIGPTPNPE